ncbi:MAG TPA: hypothetical protein VNC50_00530 [Planctomycetia bacterium]|nr:hypothetical protein [Planctomycetia bacterium]
MEREIPTCFNDSAWTIANPRLRGELLRRIRAKFYRAGLDRSEIVQDVLGAAVRHRGVLGRLSPVQRSSWFWVVVGRLGGRAAGRLARVRRILSDAAIEQVDVQDSGAEEPLAALDRAERVALVRESMQSLPTSWSRVLAARSMHPDDWNRVGVACDLAPGAARALWYRAMEGLRESLRKTQCFSDWNA